MTSKVLLFIFFLLVTQTLTLGDESKDPVVTDEKFVEVRCSLKNKGEFSIIVVPEWCPNGAQRFLDLIEDKFFENTALFRPVENFLVQFGIAKDRSLNMKWRDKLIEDDPKIGIRIKKGTLAYAGSGVNSRSTQMFIALSDRHWPHLGKEPWETPFAYIAEEDLQILDKLHFEYGDMPPWGKGPDQGRIQQKGYEYLEANFPNLDYLSSCHIRKAEIAKPVKDAETEKNWRGSKDTEDMRESLLGENNPEIEPSALTLAIPSLALMCFMAVVIVIIYMQLLKKNE